MKKEQLIKEAVAMIMGSVRNWDDGTINNPELEFNITEELTTLLTKHEDAVREEEVINIKGFLMSYAGSQNFGKMIKAVDKRLQALSTTEPLTSNELEK